MVIAFPLLEVRYRSARPHEGVLGRLPGVAGMHDVADYADARTLPGARSEAAERRDPNRGH